MKQFDCFARPELEFEKNCCGKHHTTHTLTYRCHSASNEWKQNLKGRKLGEKPHTKNSKTATAFISVFTGWTNVCTRSFGILCTLYQLSGISFHLKHNLTVRQVTFWCCHFFRFCFSFHETFIRQVLTFDSMHRCLKFCVYARAHTQREKEISNQTSRKTINNSHLGGKNR